MGHYKFIRKLDGFMESLFFRPPVQKSSSHGQQCDPDVETGEPSLSLANFQLLCLFLSFVVAMTWIFCKTCFGSIIRPSGNAIQQQSAQPNNTPTSLTDPTTKLTISSLSTWIKESLFNLWHKLHRFGAGPSSQKTTGTIPQRSAKDSSSRPMVTQTELFPRPYCHCESSRLHTGESATDHRSQEIMLMDSLRRSRSLANDGINSRGGRYTDINGRKDTRFVPHSDWKDCVNGSVESHFYWRDGIDACIAPRSDWREGIDARIEPRSDWRGGIDARIEPRSDWRDGIDARIEPRSDWRDGIDACIEPRSDWKNGKDACIQSYSDWKGDIDSYIEPHSDWMDGMGSEAKPNYIWKNDTLSRAEHQFNWKKRIESLAEQRCKWKKGTESWAEPKRGIQKNGDSWFEHSEYETVNVTPNLPTRGLARSRTNPDTSHDPDKLKKKPSSQVDPDGYFPGKQAGLTTERLANDYCNVNSDEAVSDLLQGDLGSILNKYYKKPRAYNLDFETVSGNRHTRKVTVPSMGEGFHVQAAVERKVLSIDITPSSTPGSGKRLSTTYKFPGRQSKKRNNRGRNVKQRSKRKKLSQRSNISGVSSYSSVFALLRKETVSGKPAIQASQSIISKTTESSNTTQMNRLATDLLRRIKQHNTGLDFFHYDQQSSFSSHLLSRSPVASKTDVCPQRGSQTCSDSVQGQSLSIIKRNFSTEAVINSLPCTDDLLSLFGDQPSLYGNVCVVSSSKEVLAETTASCSKPSKSHTEKRNSQRDKTNRSRKSVGRSGWSTISSGESGFLGRTVNGAEMPVCSLAPNTVFSNSRAKCGRNGTIQCPATRNVKEIHKREIGSNIKDISTKSIAVQKDICSTRDKNTIAPQYIKFPQFRQKQNQNPDGLFQARNVQCPSVSNLVYGKNVNDRERLTCVRQILARDLRVADSSNYDTDKQSILSQTDATSWSMTDQSRSSELDSFDNADVKASKNIIGKDLFEDANSQGRKELVGEKAPQKFDYKKVCSQNVYYPPRQNKINSTGHLGNTIEPKQKKGVQNQNRIPSKSTFNGNLCVNEKNTLHNVAQKVSISQMKTQQDNMPTGELSNKSTTAITKEGHKRKSLIPRHIKTLSKISQVLPETWKPISQPVNTKDTREGAATSRGSENPQGKNRFKSATTEHDQFREMANDIQKDRPSVSENVRSAKYNRFATSAGNRQTHLCNAHKGKQSVPPTQSNTANTPPVPPTQSKTINIPSVPRSSSRGPSRWGRPVVKRTQDQYRQVANCSVKRDLSNGRKHGIVNRGPKSDTVPTAYKKRINVKPSVTTSKDIFSQTKQTPHNDGLKSTLLAKTEKCNFADELNSNDKEQNRERESYYSKENKGRDKEMCRAIGSADQAPADGLSSHSASKEVSLLTLTTLNYRLMSNSPIETSEADFMKESSCETDKGKKENRCGTSERRTPKHLTQCPKTEVVMGRAFKMVGRNKSRSERATQSEATYLQRFRGKGALKSFQAAFGNANMSKTDQSFDFTDENSGGAKSLCSTGNTTEGMRRTTPSDASSTHNIQPTHNITSFKFPFDNTGQSCHGNNLTGLNDVHIHNVNTVQSARNMYRTDSAYSTNTKTIPSKHGLTLACKKICSENWQTGRPDFSARKMFRNNSRKLFSELDCNKSNTIGTVTDQRIWNTERICEEGDPGTCCRDAVKQRHIDTFKGYNKDERWFKPQSNQRSRILSRFATLKKMEDSRVDFLSGLCTNKENKKATLLKNAVVNPVLPRIELPNEEVLTSVHNRSRFLINNANTANSQYTFTCCHLLNLTPCTSQLNNAGLCQPRVNDDTQDTKQRIQLVRGIGKEAIVNQETGNFFTKYKAIPSMFDLKLKEAYPVAESQAGKQLKLGTRFCRNKKLPINISKGNNSKATTLHKNCANKVITDQPQQKRIQDRYKRLHNLLQKIPTKKLTCNQSGISKKRMKHSSTKPADKWQMKATIKNPDVIIKAKYAQKSSCKKQCKVMCKTTGVKNCSLVCSSGSVGNSRLQNNTLISGNNTVRQTKRNLLEVATSPKHKNQRDVFKSGIQNVLGRTESSTIKVEGSREFLRSKTGQLASLKSPSCDKILINKNGIGNVSNAREFTDIPASNNLNQWDAVGMNSMIQHKNITESSTVGIHRGQTSRNEEISDYQMTLSFLNNFPYRSKLAACQKNKSCCRSLKSSRSKSSAGVETTPRVCSPDRSTSSVLKVIQANSFAQLECDRMTCRSTTLVPSILDGNYDSDFVEQCNDECEAYNGSTSEQHFPNKERRADVINAIYNSETSEKSVDEADEMLNIDTVNHTPSSSALSVFPEYVSTIPKDFTRGTLGCPLRFNEKEKDNENVAFYENGHYYIQDVNDQCRSKTKCPHDQCCVPDLNLCTGVCTDGLPYRAYSNHHEQERGLLPTSQARVSTQLQEKSESFVILKGNQATNNKSDRPFSYNITSDYTNAGDNSDDLSDFLPALQENSSLRVPIEKDSINHWPRDNQSYNQYSDYQGSKLHSYQPFTKNDTTISLHRFARKNKAISHDRSMKEGKSDSKYNLSMNNKCKYHKQDCCLIIPPSLKLQRTEPSHINREMETRENRKRTYLDQSPQPEELNTGLSMNVDGKGATNIPVLVQECQKIIPCLSVKNAI